MYRPGQGLTTAEERSLSAAYLPISQKAAASGVASLGSTGTVPIAQLPLAATSIVIPGNGTPGAGVGYDGDYYLDLTAGLVWGPKASGAWPGSAAAPLTQTLFTGTTPTTSSAVTMSSGTINVCNTSGSCTFTFPASLTAGQIFAVMRGSSTSNIVLTANSGQSINGGATGGSLTLHGTISTATVLANSQMVFLQAVSSTDLRIIATVGVDGGSGFLTEGQHIVNGNFVFNGKISGKRRAGSAASLTPSNSFDFWIAATSGTGTITMTGPGVAGAIQMWSNEGTGVVTLSPASGTINGASTYVLPANSAIVTVYDGTNWKVIGQSRVNLDSSNRASLATPSVTSGTAFTPSANADTELRITCTTSSAIGVTAGPSTGAENTIVPTVTAPTGGDYSRTIPAGWKVVFTGTVANFTFQTQSL